jgi:hypothetical protein
MCRIFAESLNFWSLKLNSGQRFQPYALQQDLSRSGRHGTSCATTGGCRKTLFPQTFDRKFTTDLE